MLFRACFEEDLTGLRRTHLFGGEGEREFDEKNDDHRVTVDRYGFRFPGLLTPHVVFPICATGIYQLIDTRGQRGKVNGLYLKTDSASSQLWG